MATAYWKKCGGEDCITCCPVDLTCSCDLLDCVMDFVRYAMNVNSVEYTGYTASEVFFKGMKLVGFAGLGTYERPVIDGVPNVTFGRSLVESAIQNWAINPDEMQLCLNELDRVFTPFLDGYLVNACACDQSNEEKIACDSLKYIMATIRTFGNIGLTGKPPHTLKEWAEGGICGVCYEDCNGDPYIFEKALESAA
jgi:hypothetical protein